MPSGDNKKNLVTNQHASCDNYNKKILYVAMTET